MRDSGRAARCAGGGGAATWAGRGGGLEGVGDKAFYVVIKTHKHRSKKISNSELTITKILNQV